VPDSVGVSGALMPFPAPLLAADAVHSREMLPTVLESILLAMVEVNTRASLEPMAPYARLRDLGKSGLGGGFENYQIPSTDLRNWILKGKNAVGGDAPATQTVQERQQEILKKIEKLHTNYTNHYQAVAQRTDALDVPLSYDLRDDLIGALVDVGRAVRHLEEPEEDAW
jgi:hypothetical protein